MKHPSFSHLPSVMSTLPLSTQIIHVTAPAIYICTRNGYNDLYKFTDRALHHTHYFPALLDDMSRLNKVFMSFTHTLTRSLLHSLLKQMDNSFDIHYHTYKAKKNTMFGVTRPTLRKTIPDLGKKIPPDFSLTCQLNQGI